MTGRLIVTPFFPDMPLPELEPLAGRGNPSPMKAPGLLRIRNPQSNLGTWKRVPDGGPGGKT